MERIKRITSNLDFKAVLFSAPMFLQFLYAIRDLWWGIGAYFFDLYFSVRALDYLTSNPISLGLVLLGLMGLWGVLSNNYILNILFGCINIFLFASVALTFFQNDPTSVAGVNYTIEMFGVVWLVFRVQYDRSKSTRYKKFSE